MIYREMSKNINGSSVASDDAHKRKQIQQQLILIFHACRCQKHYEINREMTCTSPHCLMMRRVLAHMAVCNKDKFCSFMHCSTSKRILAHWKKCGKLTCLICAPIKNRQQGNKSDLNLEVKPNHDPKDEMYLNDEKSEKYFENIQEFSDKGKEWKNGFKDKDIRKRLINIIVETILPVKDCDKAYMDERMSDIINHAKAIENKAFINSSTTEEYFKILAQSCYKIHKTVCINQTNSEQSVSCPEFSSQSPKISVSERIELSTYGTFSQHKSNSDSDHLNQFQKVLQNEYEFQRKLLLNEGTTTTNIIKTEVKEEPNTAASLKDITEENSVKVWSKEELYQSFNEFFEFLKTKSHFFSQADSKSEYNKSPSKPISFSAICLKLNDGQYSNPWDVIDDINSVVKNAYVCSRKSSRKFKKNLDQVVPELQNIMDIIMTKMGFCCGREEVYQPLTLVCCTARVCTISKDSVYYAYPTENDDSKDPSLAVDSYLCCEKCYTDSGSDVSFIGDSNELFTVKKESLVKRKNNIEIQEEFVICGECKRKWHKVCACHLDEIWSTFYCTGCAEKKSIKKDNKYTARRLPTCVLSNFLEKRVNDYLKKNELDAENVIVRVLSNVQKHTDVKKRMRVYYEGSQAKFPYRSKAIFAFQELEGKEVCFFGLHVQEYGSDSPEPNRRRVYLAYLDSVRFFEPSKHRTKVYYEILVGYLDYVKKLGYVMAHIWACPPNEGDDYIFHCHPPDQKIPKSKRLIEWYQKMLDKGMQELVVHDYKDIYKDVNQSGKSLHEIPYFEGDYWPTFFEDTLKEFEENSRRAKEMPQDDDDADSLDGCDVSGTDRINRKVKKRKQKKAANLTTSKRRKIQDTGDASTDFIRKVFENMEKLKDNFFSIRLHSDENIPTKDTLDPDSIVESELMDGRENFLQLARSKHLEFSSLRRTLYSTLVMCYELHNENKQSFCYTCNSCNLQIETRFHCRQCEEFDLCQKCYETKSHVHPMVKIKSGMDDNGDSNSRSDCEETSRGRLDKLVKNFEHAFKCRDMNCRMANCADFKRRLNHNKACKDVAKCQSCKVIMRLSAFHAKYCTDNKCMLQLCHTLKQKLRRQENQQRFHQKQILRRRTALMRCNSNISNTPSTLSLQENGGNTSVVQSPYQFIQGSTGGPMSAGSTNQSSVSECNSLKMSCSTTNNINNVCFTSNKNNFLPHNQTISSLSADTSNLPPCNVYPNGGGGGNFSAMNKPGGFHTPNKTNDLIPSDPTDPGAVYVNYINPVVDGGQSKFTDWIKTAAATNHPPQSIQYVHHRQLSKTHIPNNSPIYQSNIPQSAAVVFHNAIPRISGGNFPAQQPNQPQAPPMLINNAPVQQSINMNLPPSYNLPPEMRGHINPNSKPPPSNLMGMMPNPMQVGNMGLPAMNRMPMNSYTTQGQQQQQQYIMNNFIQSNPNHIRYNGNYPPLGNGIAIGHTPNITKLMENPKGLPPSAQLTFQNSNSSDPRVYRAHSQNFYDYK